VASLVIRRLHGDKCSFLVMSLSSYNSDAVRFNCLPLHSVDSDSWHQLRLHSDECCLDCTISSTGHCLLLCHLQLYNTNIPMAEGVLLLIII